MNKIFVANWKSHNDVESAKQFFNSLNSSRDSINWNDRTIIIAPPYPLFSICKEEVQKMNLPISICSQDVSAFPTGAYTGEVNASLTKEFADFAIIGHSERRTYFHEDDNILQKKVSQALENGLKIIFCVQNEDQKVPVGVELVAYEPPTAIGTGNPDDPLHVEQTFQKILERNSNVKVLYGGSITPDNISSFLTIKNLSGFLIGGASLNADTFVQLINKW